MGRLAAGVAHEARGPLYSMLAVLDTFDERFLERSKHQEYSGHLRVQVASLIDLMEGVP